MLLCCTLLKFCLLLQSASAAVAAVEEEEEEEYTPFQELMDCARYGEVEDVRRILATEVVDINSTDEYGNTPAHYGAKARQLGRRRGGGGGSRRCVGCVHGGSGAQDTNPPCASPHLGCYQQRARARAKVRFRAQLSLLNAPCLCTCWDCVCLQRPPTVTLKSCPC